MRSTLFVLSMILGGCIAFASGNAHANDDYYVEGFWDKFICMGAGTCYRDANGDLRKSPDGPPSSGSYNSNSNSLNQGAVIVTNSGNYVVIPNARGGAYPAAIIRSGK